jgi:sugar phosphate permease
MATAPPRDAPTRGLHWHYAWVIVIGSVVIEFFGIGFGFFALVASYPYFEGLGWARTTVVASSSLMITTIAILSPLTGAYMDKRSIRQLFVAGGLIMALGHALLGMAETPLAFFVGAIVLGVGMAGVTVLPNQVLIARWFKSRLGLANGVISAGTVLGGSVSTMVVTLCSESYGRRFAFFVLAACVGIVPPLVGVFVVRDRPSDLGLSPYDEGDAGFASSAQRADVTLRTVLADPTFWLLTVGLLLATVPCYTSNKHLILYLHDLGLDATSAATVKSLMILVAGVGRIVAGVLADRFDRFWTLVGFYALSAVSFPLVFAMPAKAALVGYVVLFGLAYGGVMPMMPIMVVECFGIGALGVILGVMKIAYDAGAATAPLAAAYAYDQLGNYDLVFAINWACAVAAVGCALALIARRRRTATSERRPRAVALG